MRSPEVSLARLEHLPQEESRAYWKLFKKLTGTGAGSAEGSVVREFLQRANLSEKLLQEVWRLAHLDESADFESFCVACRLVAHAQDARSITAAQVAEVPSKAPNFEEDFDFEAVAMGVSPGQGQPSHEPAPEVPPVRGDRITHAAAGDRTYVPIRPSGSASLLSKGLGSDWSPLERELVRAREDLDATLAQKAQLEATGFVTRRAQRYPEASVQIYSRQVRDAKPQAPPEIVATHDILHQAAASGQQDEVQRLLELRCELLKVDSWGRNALHWAAEHGHVGCCNAILRAAESKDVLQQLCTLEDSSSRTPLNAALRAVPQKAQQLARLCIQRADELQVEAKSPRSRDAPQTHTRVKEELKATVKEEAASEQKDVKQELTGVPFQPGERPAYAALSKANEPGRAMRGWASRSRSRSPCPSGSLKPSRKPSLSKPVESSRNQTYGYERPSLRMHTVQLDAETRNKLLKALADQEPRKAKVESEAEPVQARLEELAREATLQREVEEKQKLRVKLEQVLERAQRLEEEQSQTQGECAQLQARLQELQASRAALQHAAENEPLHAELEQAKAKEATRLKKENDDLQVQLQKAQLQVRQLQSQADSLQDTQETLQRSQREKDGLQSELQKVQLQAQQGQKQVDSLKDKVTELQRVQEESARSKKEKDGLQAELQKVELQAQQWQKHIDSLKAPGEATGLYQICFHHPETREPLVPGTPEYALLLPKILAGLPSATRSWLESLLETGRAPGPLPEEPELPKRSDVQACQAKVKELQDAQEALQRSKREKDGLQAELQKALLQAQQGQRQVDSLQEKVAELQGIKEDSARSKKEKDGWQAELKKAQLQARQSQSQIDSLQAKVTELQGVQEESARSKKEKDGLQAELQKVQLQAQQGQRQVDSLQAGEATGLYQICFHHPETREPLVPGTPEYALMLPKILAGLPSATRSWLESLLETGKAPGPLPEEPELPKRSDVRACQADLKRKRQELAQKPAPEDIPGCDETRQLYKICFHDPDTGRPLVKGMPGFATIARTALQHMEGQPQWIQDLLRSLAE
ncbi:unnamed protein product [Effrenium voratum]|uniref:EH domain-containing protein n=1 Tax=Effrenium voratum TaxID=2562239 RepID=A0AA36N1V0_9DINO|nr:unnamed protein product [Effrenium voratum]